MLLVLILLITALPVQVFGKNIVGVGTPTLSDTLGTQEEIEAARETYLALTPEVKAIFDASLVDDPKMLEFHLSYVDKSFTPPAAKVQARSANAVVADPMRVLMEQLGGLGLPSSVLYSLKAMGAGMVAAIADGPLPIGDILLAAATASTAIVIAANWDQVAPKWDGIVRAFQKAFSKTASNVSAAFLKIKSDAKKKAKEAFDKSASNAINGCDSNKQNHILNNKLHDHAWKKLFNGKDPKWKQLAPILIETLKEGTETVYSKSQGVYERTLRYKGYDVVVRFIKAADGTVKHLSTAYLK